MKKKANKFVIKIFILFMFFSCSQNKVLTNLDTMNREVLITLNEIVCTHQNSSIHKSGDTSYWIRNIVWNSGINCGLLDVSIASKNGGVYYPILVTKDGQIVQLFTFGERKAIENYEIVLDEYYKNHFDLYSNSQLELIHKRLELGIITTTSSITSNIFNGLTEEIDSLYTQALNNSIQIEKCR